MGTEKLWLPGDVLIVCGFVVFTTVRFMLSLNLFIVLVCVFFFFFFFCCCCCFCVCFFQSCCLFIFFFFPFFYLFLVIISLGEERDGIYTSHAFACLACMRCFLYFF